MYQMSVYSDITERLASAGNLRVLPPVGSREGITDLSSNDYLGLAADPSLQADFMSDPVRRAIPLTSAASRLLAGRQEEYASLEALLGELYGRPALLFNSGYHANTGLVAALAGGVPDTLVVADRLVHASIIDGIVLSRAPFTRFRHNDMNNLEKVLAKESPRHKRVLLIVESVYSMDGDRADIDALTELKRHYPGVMIYVDEAHGFGVEGERGLGLCRSAAGYGDIDIVVGTFGKACASMGAFAAVSPDIKSYLVNTARSLIFSTALPPFMAAWTEWVIRRMTGMDDRRARLRELSSRLHSILAPLQPAVNVTPSHIQPLVTGDPRKAVELSQRLLEAGFKVLPIRTPTVPPGTERLRFSLSASIPMSAIDNLEEFFRKHEI